ncbi:Uncharacterised protein [Achromobacter sp. 2789STDY5608628]|nr:Uncharacterised protein [Achromobacter sp. 2789STDY5608628]
MDPELPGQLPLILSPYFISIWVDMDGLAATGVQARPVHTERDAAIGRLL